MRGDVACILSGVINVTRLERRAHQFCRYFMSRGRKTRARICGIWRCPVSGCQHAWQEVACDGQGIIKCCYSRVNTRAISITRPRVACRVPGIGLFPFATLTPILQYQGYQGYYFHGPTTWAHPIRSRVWTVLHAGMAGHAHLFFVCGACHRLSPGAWGDTSGAVSGRASSALWPPHCGICASASAAAFASV